MDAAGAPRIAVLVRFRNERRYIGSVLRAVRSQRVGRASLRIVGIDDGSWDGSRAVADGLCDAVHEIDEFMPGSALNLALALEPCDYAAVVAAHAIPATDTWLAALLEAAAKPDTLA